MLGRFWKCADHTVETPVPYIDIHTHDPRREPATVTVRNIFPGERIHTFTGQNFLSVGLHPWKITSKEHDNDLLVMMEDALNFDHLIFVGECGLDKRVKTDLEEQLRVFKAQVFMAEEFQKPLIIHCVKAWNEVVEIYKNTHPSVPWIFHAYNGSPELTSQLVRENILFSFGASLFKEHNKAIESFRLLPTERIFFETDELDEDVENIYKRGAELKGISLESLKRSVWENFNRLENVRLAEYF